MKRSNRPVKSLHKIIRPYIFTPTKDISGAINGLNFYFPANKKAILNESQYMVIMHSDYKGQL